MKIKEGILIVAVFMIVCSSFKLPQYIIISQEKSMINQIEYINNNYFSDTENQLYSLPIISDFEELCLVYVHGEKTDAETIPTNEKAPLVLIELVQAEISKLQEGNDFMDGNFIITDTPTPFLYTFYDYKTIVWEFKLVDEENNILHLIYHSGVGKIIEINYFSLDFDVTADKTDFFNNLIPYFNTLLQFPDYTYLIPRQPPFSFGITQDFSIYYTHNDTNTGFHVYLLPSNYIHKSNTDI